jgi:hypothetical protein
MKFVLSGLFVLISFLSYSQDLIVKRDSSNIFCEIIKEDSSSIYYKQVKGDAVLNLSINKSNVLKCYNSKAMLQNQIRMADSIAKAKSMPVFKTDSLFYDEKKKFTYHNMHFGNHKALILLEDNAEAHTEMKEAINSNLGNIFSTTISISSLVGFAVYTAIENKPIWAVGGVGVGFSVISFACGYFYHKHCYKAVSIYNSKLKVAAVRVPKFEIGMASRGLGVSIKF